MKIYSFYGFNDFIICCGYKGHIIKEFFQDYYVQQPVLFVDLKTEAIEVPFQESENWTVTLINTGRNTKTAGRVLKIRQYLNEKPFMLTYGDGVADINLHKLLTFHQNHGKAATITVTKPAGRFGSVSTGPEDTVLSFREKANKDQEFVNAGFAVFNPDIFDYLGDGSYMLEELPFENIAYADEMKAYRHDGFWAPMDSMRDKDYLETLWGTDKPPWKIWVDE